MGEREWKTEDEIRYIVNDELKELIKDLRNGAQASMNIATMLAGDARFGILGHIPETTRRLDAIEKWRRDKDRVDDDRWNYTEKEFKAVKERQHLIKRICGCWAYDAFGNRTLERVGSAACNSSTATPTGELQRLQQNHVAKLSLFTQRSYI